LHKSKKQQAARVAERAEINANKDVHGQTDTPELSGESRALELDGYDLERNVELPNNAISEIDFGIVTELPGENQRHELSS